MAAPEIVCEERTVIFETNNTLENAKKVINEVADLCSGVLSADTVETSSAYTANLYFSDDPSPKTGLRLLYSANSNSASISIVAKTANGVWSPTAYGESVTQFSDPTTGHSDIIRFERVGTSIVGVSVTNTNDHKTFHTKLLARFKDALNTDLVIGLTGPEYIVNNSTSSYPISTHGFIYYDYDVDGWIYMAPYQSLPLAGPDSGFNFALQPVCRTLVTEKKLYRDVTFDGAYLYAVRTRNDYIGLPFDTSFKVNGQTYKSFCGWALVPLEAAPSGV